MVYYFTSKLTSPSATIYVGKDKFESLHPLAASFLLVHPADTQGR